MAEKNKGETIEVIALVDGQPWKRVFVYTSTTEFRVPYFDGYGWDEYLGEMAPRFGHYILRPTGRTDEHGTPIWSAGTRP